MPGKTWDFIALTARWWKPLTSFCLGTLVMVEDTC